MARAWETLKKKKKLTPALRQVGSGSALDVFGPRDHAWCF